MPQLLSAAGFTFHEGRAEEFDRLSAHCMEVVRNNGTPARCSRTFELMAAIREIGTLEARRWATRARSSARC